MRCGSLAVSASASSWPRSRVGGQHDLDQRLRARRGLLRQPADALARAMGDPAVLGGELAGDDVKQRGLAGAVAADQPDPRAIGNARRGVVDQQASGDADGKVFNDEHAVFWRL